MESDTDNKKITFYIDHETSLYIYFYCENEINYKGRNCRSFRARCKTWRAKGYPTCERDIIRFTLQQLNMFDFIE